MLYIYKDQHYNKLAYNIAFSGLTLAAPCAMSYIYKDQHYNKLAYNIASDAAASKAAAAASVANDTHDVPFHCQDLLFTLKI